MHKRPDGGIHSRAAVVAAARCGQGRGLAASCLRFFLLASSGPLAASVFLSIRLSFAISSVPFTRPPPYTERAYPFLWRQKTAFSSL